jgi:acyl-homoserine lactone acylase PvdQ
MAGAGVILSGRSNYVAYGVTTLYADVSDFLVEKIEGEKYLYEGEYRTLGVIEEVVHVKG